MALDTLTSSDARTVVVNRATVLTDMLELYASADVLNAPLIVMSPLLEKLGRTLEA